jgi:putative flippase GtrA
MTKLTMTMRKIEMGKMKRIKKLETTTSSARDGDVPTTTRVRWCKFNLVGGVGIGVQFGALFLLKSVLHVNYLAASAIAVETAVVHNFLWHERFTWADRTKSGGRSLSRLLRFNLTTGAVSIFGSVALMKVMVGFGHTNYLLVNGVAIALCSLANFMVSDNWVFEGARDRHPVPRNLGRSSRNGVQNP